MQRAIRNTPTGLPVRLAVSPRLGRQGRAASASPSRRAETRLSEIDAWLRVRLACAAMAAQDRDAVEPRHLELLTPRLHLVRLREEHLDDLVALDADPEVMQFLPTAEPNTRERYERELLPRMMAWEDRAYGFLAAYEGGAFIGWFHLRPSVADASMLEVGYRLRRLAWGRGLATEGTRALLRHAFDTLGEEMVDACTLPDNHASIAVMRKCGMRHAGAFIHPRMSTPVVRYLVRRDEVDLGDATVE